MAIKQLLSSMEEKGASDLFLSVGTMPRLRIDGKVCPMDLPVIMPAEMNKIIAELLDTEERKKKFKEEQTDCRNPLFPSDPLPAY